MEFQPFGVQPNGAQIRDLSGLVIRADLEYLEDYVGRSKGLGAGRLAVEDLVHRLNDRMPDSAYKVTEAFLRNPWNSYSAEFSAFIAEFCIAISGDANFLFNMARYKAISPIIQTLGKPFSVAQIYRMSAYFAQRYAKDSFFTEAVEVSEGFATIQMRLSEHTYQQFGRYRLACAEHWCNAHKGYFAGAPAMFHGLPAATVRDRRCIARGDDRCEWVLAWSAKPRRLWPTFGSRRRATQAVRQAEPPTAQPVRSIGSVEESAGSSMSAAAIPSGSVATPVLLSKEHPITEKGMMEFQPFGTDSNGRTIEDMSGVVIRALVDYLEDSMSRKHGSEAGSRAIEELVHRLNDRIQDRAYHVTGEFLKNPWHSYSNEFGLFLTKFCWDISEDPQFSFNMARDKAISPVIQALGRPFSVAQIYKMSAYFSQRFAKDSFYTEAVHVSNGRAIIQMRFSDHALQQFGPYLRACAEMYCLAHKGYFAGVPERFHSLPLATVKDRKCIANGDDCCEWEVKWSDRKSRVWSVIGWFARSPESPKEEQPASSHTASPMASSDSLAGHRRIATETESGHLAPAAILSKEHPITEKGKMEFQPFGTTPEGAKIQDFSGVVLKASVEHLEQLVSRAKGAAAGQEAVGELVKRLNERIPDYAFHVTAESLRSPWNSYSMEFAAFFAQFCVGISEDPQFHFDMCRFKVISPIIRTMGLPFSIAQIYKASPYFERLYYQGPDIFSTEVVREGEASATMRMRLGERTRRQWGQYFRGCAIHWCAGTRGYWVGIPEIYRGLPQATVADRRCMAQGDDYCEWDVTWAAEKRRLWPVFGSKKRRVRAATLAESSAVPPVPLMVSSPCHSDSTIIRDAESGDGALTGFLSKEHRITEKGKMEFQPFGRRPDGTTIRDLSGVVTRAHVERLEDLVGRQHGAEAGRLAVERLVTLLNERIPDRAYHVTERFLRNPWHSYSTEFSAFVGEFCIDLSGDPIFEYGMARGKAIPSAIRVLGRPFSVPQIYKMSAYFSKVYAESSFLVQAMSVSNRSAVIRMTLSDQTFEQFGRYRRRCANLYCIAVKGYLEGVPESFHNLSPATTVERTCVANGDDFCEWEVTWASDKRRAWPGFGWVANHQFGQELEKRQQIIDQQAKSLDEWFQELKSAHAQQQQLSAELQRRLTQLTTLHDAGLAFTSTLDRESLIKMVLETAVHKLNYDRAMITSYDPVRRVAHDARILGVSDDVAEFTRSLEVPVTEPTSIEGTVLLQGVPILVPDIREVWERLHPLYQQLTSATNAKSFVSVPLKAKDRVLGSLTVDRTQPPSLMQDDLDLMVTFANQAAIALDNAKAYQEIEELNVGLEAKVRARTTELETANERLKELDRMKGEFFANINHELRTPLTVSLGAFRTLLKSQLTKESQTVIESGLRNTSRLLFLINELLELAKFESGQPALKEVCIDFTSLIKTVAANFELSERQRVFIECPRDPLPVVVDVRRMTKVVYNLLVNAFKFSDPESGKVWIRLRPERERVFLEIQDNGIGIAENQLDRIFDRFYQVEGQATRRFEGSGIGLALAKEIVTLHGGEISARSTLGEGATFTVTLPRGDLTAEHLVPIDEEDVGILPLPEQEITQESEGDVASTGGTERPQVLVADDNADMRAYLIRLLSDEYRVVAACDGAEAMEKARELKPALILADMMMPVMSGYDLLKAVRTNEELAVIPFIMLTARAGTEARAESFEAGADDYISKPFHEEELFSRVKNQLRIRQQERELQSRAAQLQHLYSQLETANAELRELSNRKSEFISIVSHDLRTPLTAVTSFLDNMLEGMAGPLTEKQEVYVRRIKSNIWRLIRMVADLLDLARIESGNVHFNPQAVAVVGFIESLVENLQPVAEEKSLRLHAVRTEPDVLVQADPDKLAQILTNLVHNACKFTPSGGEVRVETEALDDGFVRICVADTGQGIPSEELPHVFQRFYSGKSSSREVRGAGLGLAIVKHFVELHGGRIWVESIQGSGSQFYFTIPMSQEFNA